MKKRLATISCLFCLFVLPTSSGAEAIKIGLLAGFTGVANIPSHHLIQTVSMESDRINAAGGIGGKKIELVIHDDDSNPIKTRALVKSGELDDVVGVIGFPWSQFILVAGPELQKRAIPAISILATHDKATHAGDYVFRVCFSNSYQGKILSRYAFKEIGARRSILFVNQQNSYSVDLASVIRQTFEDQGGVIVKEVEYIPQMGADSFIEQLKGVSRFDSVFLPDDQVYVLPILEALRTMRHFDKKIFGGDGWNSANIAKRKEHYYEFDIYVVAHWNENDLSKDNINFIERFKRTDSSDPQDASALSYDAFSILIAAVRKTPSLDRSQIRNAIAGMSYDGLTGRIVFDAQGNPKNKPLVIYRVYHGKRIAVVYE